MKWSRRVFSCLATLLLGVGLAGLVAPAGPAEAAGQPGKFYDGGIKYSTIVNCASIIFGAPYTEHGIDTYVGSWADPDDNLPRAAGASYPVHVVVSGPGRACDAQLFQLGLKLPAGVTLDSAKAPECYYQGTRTTAPAECPTAFQSGTYGSGTVGYRSGMSQYAYGWPVPVGKIWEFRFWVKASQPVSGAELRAFVDIADGNNDPVLQPTAPMYAFSASGGGGGTGGTAEIFHSAPSTYASPTYTLNGTTGNTKYGILSAGTLSTKGQYGTVHLRRGTSATNLNQSANYYFGLDDPAFLFWTDWDEAGFSPLVANTMYYWQLGFQPTGSSSITWGPVESFRSLRQATCDGKKVTVSLDLGQVPTTGDDVILGTAGNDTINAGDGNDAVCGGGGADSISGGDGGDHLYGEAGNDIIDGGNGHDEIEGGDGNDIVTGGDGGDFLAGNAGDDLLEGGPGSDQFRGGAGTDTITYATAPSAVTVDMSRQDLDPQNTGGAGIDEFQGINKLIGSDHNDTLYGSVGNDTIDGGKGNDLIDGRAGDDLLRGGAGVDRLSYASLPHAATPGVTVSLARTDRQWTVASGFDTISGFENLEGSSRGDHLMGDTGSNTIRGLAGIDRLDGGGGGTDVLDGGADTGVLDFKSARGGVTVSLATTTPQVTGGAGTVTLVGSFLQLEGSPYDDRLTGSSANEVIIGGDGNDVIEGLGGNDALHGNGGIDTVSYANSSAGVSVDLSKIGQQNTGGAGTDDLTGFEILEGSAHADTLTGTDKADTIRGLAGNDTLRGLGGSDILDGGAGNDAIDGGSGTDLVTYATATAGVTVSLGTTGAQNTKGAGTDTLAGLEHLDGSRYADRLTGSAAANRIRGGAGNDTISGAGGNDVLYGEAGNDALSGGGGNDVLYGEAGNDTLSGGAGHDTLHGGVGNDTLNGNTGNDKLNGNAGNDKLTGAGGKDKLLGGAGKDTLKGGAGNDVVQGQSGADQLFGNGGKDKLHGGAGNDRLYGNGGADQLNGGAGKDKLYGGAGKDKLVGGPARDLCDGGAAKDKMAGCEVKRRP